MKQKWLVNICLFTVSVLTLYTVARICTIRGELNLKTELREVKEQLSKAKTEADTCREGYNAAIVHILRDLRNGKEESK